MANTAVVLNQSIIDGILEDYFERNTSPTDADQGSNLAAITGQTPMIQSVNIRKVLWAYLRPPPGKKCATMVGIAALGVEPGSAKDMLALLAETFLPLWKWTTRFDPDSIPINHWFKLGRNLAYHIPDATGITILQTHYSEGILLLCALEAIVDGIPPFLPEDTANIMHHVIANIFTVCGGLAVIDQLVNNPPAQPSLKENPAGLHAECTYLRDQSAVLGSQRLQLAQDEAAHLKESNIFLATANRNTEERCRHLEQKLLESEESLRGWESRMLVDSALLAEFQGLASESIVGCIDPAYINQNYTGTGL